MHTHTHTKTLTDCDLEISANRCPRMTNERQVKERHHQGCQDYEKLSGKTQAKDCQDCQTPDQCCNKPPALETT